MKYYLSLALVMLLLVSCKNETKTETANATDVHKAIAQEVFHVSQYTYIRGMEDGVEKWVAGPITDIKVGETFYFGKSMEMPNFQSKELNKTFETVYFVEKISTTEEGLESPMVSGNTTATTGAQRTAVEKKDVKIEREHGDIDIFVISNRPASLQNSI